MALLEKPLPSVKLQPCTARLKQGLFLSGYIATFG